ncbi:MAG: hypothetical protein IIC82_08060 [Chloroflexi bacterium]|nr:hypothetical protein [Chloroflexota bacterium]
MTELLKKAFRAASRLPSEQQDAVATMLLAELESERQWDDAFARSQDFLATLADEAIAEAAAGKTEPLVTDR